MANQEDWHCSSHDWVRREFDRLAQEVIELRGHVRKASESIAALKVKAGFIGVLSMVGGAVAFMVWKWMEK